MKCTVYENNEQDSVREKNAKGWEAYLDRNDEGRALKKVTLQLIQKIQLCEELV